MYHPLGVDFLVKHDHYQRMGEAAEDEYVSGPLVQDDDVIRDAIRKEAKEYHGSVYRWAMWHGLDPQNVYAVLRGERKVPSSMGNIVGYARVIGWVYDRAEE